MEKSKQPQNGLGLVVLFLALTAGGIILSWVYLGLIDLIPFIYLNFLTVMGFTMGMALIVSFVKRKFSITSAVGSVAVVLLALLVINVFRGQFWIALWYNRYWGYDINVFLDIGYIFETMVWLLRDTLEHGINPVAEFFSDLSVFNELGTWGLGGGTLVTGGFLWFIWVVELIVICSMPLITAVEPVGVFLQDRGVLARSQPMPYRFAEFSKDELYRIESGETSVIVGKPLIITGNGHQVALLYDGEERTEFISIHKIPKEQGKISPRIANAMTHGRALAVVRLTPDAIDSLIKQLDEKHGATASFVSIVDNEESADDTDK